MKRNASIGLLLAMAGVAWAGAPAPFTEQAITRGINYPVQVGSIHFGSGLGLFDIDADGDPDALVVGQSDGRVGLYENDGAGNFTMRTYDNGVPRMALHTDYSGVSAADFDGDGDLDIYLSRYTGPNRFYRNEGNWVFTDIAAAAGVADTGAAVSTAWADCNADGRLDLYVCNRTGTDNNWAENAFYENNGDGTFTEKAAFVGIQRAGDPTLVAAFFDYDADSDPDLYLGTDKGSAKVFTNHFFENLGSAFMNVTGLTGTEANIDCMGIALSDFDRNGWLDMYLTNLPAGNVMYMANGDGTFTDRAVDAGTASYIFGWSTVAFDFDNDTWDDIYICNANAANSLYRNPGSFPFSEIGASMGVATTGTSYCSATADVDNDGDLDLMISHQFQRIRLFINNEGSTRSWAKFDVVGEGAMNRFGIGAQVRVWTAADGPLIREVRAGHNYKAQEPTTVHIGLGDASVMDTIVVTWPNTGVTRTLHNYAADRRWTLYPPNRIGDYDLDGDVDDADRSAAHARFQQNGAEPIEPGLEMLDADGDGDFDADDLALIGDAPCPADLVAPFGVLDLADISAFVGGFVAQDPIADLTGDGLFDLGDLSAFVTAFVGGCP
jgi:hypothetical protein